MNRLEDVMDIMDKVYTTPKHRKNRIYVAGAMSDPKPINFLKNLARGIKASVDVLRAGYAVFSPFIDFQFFLNLRDGEDITLDMIQESSLAWLICSDAMLVLPNFAKSEGTLREIEFARSFHVPIYYDLETLKKEVR